MNKVNLGLNEIAVALPALNEGGKAVDEIKRLQEIGLNNFVVGIDPSTRDDTKKYLDELGIHSVVAEFVGYDCAMFSASNKILEIYPEVKFILYSTVGGKYQYEFIDKFVEETNQGVQYVIGVRSNENKSMLKHQKGGTSVILSLINTLFRSRVDDISPVVLLSTTAYQRLNMSPRKFRWTTEMLVKVLALGIPYTQVKIQSNQRVGKSKISGNLSTSLKAGIDMLSALRFWRYTEGKN